MTIRFNTAEAEKILRAYVLAEMMPKVDAGNIYPSIYIEDGEINIEVDVDLAPSEP